MFKALFLATLLITLVVNIIFLFATKEKPPDPGNLSSTFGSLAIGEELSSPRERRLFLRSNGDFYDYTSTANAEQEAQNSSSRTAGALHQGFNEPMDTEIRNNGSKEQEGPNMRLKQMVFSREVKPTFAAAANLVTANQLTIEGDNNQDLTQNDIDNDRQPMRKASESWIENGRNVSGGKALRISQLVSKAPNIKRRDEQMGPMKARAQPTSTYSSRMLDIKVKSSRNHVFVSVNNIIIYESGYSSANSGLPRPVSSSNSWPQTSSATTAATMAATGSEDSTETSRGIHVVVLNQFDGSVMAKRVFDTYSPGQDEELCFFINMVRDGRILIMAVKDEASFKMPMNSPARRLIQQLGSEHIMKLKWRDMWAFVAPKRTVLETNTKLGESLPAQARQRLHKAAAARSPQQLNQANLAEALAKSSRFSDWAPPAVLEARIELSLEKQVGQEECDWSSSDQEEDRRRAEFCSRIEGYGSLCDCDSPAPISFESKQIQNTQLNQVPIVVMASNRPYYLYRMLRSLLKVQGLNTSMVTIFIDGFYDEPQMVGRLFNLRAIQQRPLGQRSARISHHYKSSLTATFELFPRAEFAIIFEEDLDISSDALVYFNQTMQLLKEDPTLYCSSAWNDQGYEHSARNNSLLYRIETMPGLGWMLSRQLYKRELEPNWPSPDQPHDWDMWIRTESVRRGRECIIPDISRTFHFGSTGTNINSYFQKQYFSKHAFNLVPSQKFANLNEMSSRKYEQLIERLLREAHPIGSAADRGDGGGNATVDPLDFLCSLSRIEAHELASSSRGAHKVKLSNDNDNSTSGHTANNVIYIEMIDKQDFKNWLKLAKCWHIWDLDARGQHNSMWRLFLGAKPTLIVGVPASPYARFKPADLKPFKL